MKKIKRKNKKNKVYFAVFIGIAFLYVIVILSKFENAREKAEGGALYQILSTGQSLSVGATGRPALTTTQEFDNKMLDGNNIKLIPLVEPSATYQDEGGETMGAAMANALSILNGKDFQTVVTNHGQGGFSYDQLKRGTKPYEVGMRQLRAVHDYAILQGKKHEVIGVTVVHGENDQIGIWNNWHDWKSKGYQKPADVYKDHLVEWQKDYENDIKAVTSQKSVPLYIDQMSSHTGAGSAVPISALGQLEAAEENPGKIILVGPKYFFNYNDNYHMNNYSYRLLGEYYGKVINQVFLQKKNWLPLMPIAINRADNFIRVKFHVPDPATKIEFDMQNVDPMPNMGFEYSDSSGVIGIEKVEIENSDTVKITLTGTPSPQDQKTLNYAYTGTPGANPGAHSSGSAKGNLRDNDPTISAYDQSVHLYNWAVHFSQPIE